MVACTFGSLAGLGFHAAFHVEGPTRDRVQKHIGVCRFHGGQGVQCIGPSLGAMFPKVLRLHPGSVCLGEAMDGLSGLRSRRTVLHDVQHDRMGVEGLDLLQSPPRSLGFEHAKNVIHERHHGRFMERHTHRHIDAVFLGGQRLQDGSQTASIGEHHQGAVQFFWGECGQDVSHILGLTHS